MRSETQPSRPSPVSRDTLRLSARAMACEFSVIMNAGSHEALWQSSVALDLAGTLDEQLSAYRPNSEVSQINARAADQPFEVRENLYQLLRTSLEIWRETGGAFDITAGPLIQLWRECRDQRRQPTDNEIAARRDLVGSQFIQLDDASRTIEFGRRGVAINLGGIGKGFALDQVMQRIREQGYTNTLLHGGQSSVIASGNHSGCDGWPVGLGNPLMTRERLGTILLRNQALGTSGSNLQYFRVKTQRYGHIVDPRNGWPRTGSEGILSATALSSSAAEADALSTAFYLLPLEDIAAFCGRRPDVGAIIIPRPTSGRSLQPVVFGVKSDQLFWEHG